MLDEFLVIGTLDLATGLAQLTVGGDLLGQVGPKELSFLPLRVEVALDLIEGLLRAKVSLVVQRVDILLNLLDVGPFVHLIADEVTVGLVHHHTVVVGEGVLLVHVVDGGVELLLLELTAPLNTLNIAVETGESLLIYGSDRFKSAATFVSSVVINSEGALRAEELRHRGVVFVRDLLTIQGSLNLSHLLNDAGRVHL